MKKLKKPSLSMIEIIGLTFIGIVILGIVVVILSFAWDKHQQEREYNAAILKCGGTVYEISSEVDFENVQHWTINKDSGKFKYAPLGNIWDYACSLEEAKKILVQQHEVPLNEIEINNVTP